jgi:hypothetical protein
VRFEYRKVVVDVVTMEQLSKLAKEVMNASVDAQFLGLLQVSSYLGMAFEEVVRVAAELNTDTGAVEVKEPSVLRGEFESGR